VIAENQEPMFAIRAPETTRGPLYQRCSALKQWMEPGKAACATRNSQAAALLRPAKSREMFHVKHAEAARRFAGAVFHVKHDVVLLAIELYGTSVGTGDLPYRAFRKR